MKQNNNAKKNWCLEMKERSRKLKDVQYYLKTQRKEKREFPREQSRGGGDTRTKRQKQH